MTTVTLVIFIVCSMQEVVSTRGLEAASKEPLHNHKANECRCLVVTAVGRIGQEHLGEAMKGVSKVATEGRRKWAAPSARCLGRSLAVDG